MNKCEFLTRLALELKGLPREDTERWMEYYKEMLDDRIEDGMSEEEAVASLGKPDKIVKEILVQTSFTKLIKNKLKPSRKLQVWEIVLICLGSPIWVSLAVSVAATIFSVFVSLWAVIVSLWVTELSLAVSGVAGVLGTILSIALGRGYQGVLLLGGGGLFCGGVAYFGFYSCINLTKLFARVNKKCWLFVKSLFVAKEGK